MSRSTNETNIHETLRKNIKNFTDIKLHSKEMSVFDAYNDKYILEYKYRKKHAGAAYPDLLLEKKKFDNCMKIAEEKDREFLYICWYRGHLYIYNISRMAAEGYDFGWRDGKFNKTTEFHSNALNGVKVEKRISMLPRQDAHIKLKCSVSKHRIMP